MADVARYAAEVFTTEHPDIRVEVVGIPYTDHLNKLLVTLSSGAYAYDALEFTPDWGAIFTKNGWLLPLDRWWNEDDPYFADFLMVDVLSKYEGAPPELAGTYYGLPFNTDVKMLVYRKDLYEANNLTPPTTWEEFIYNSVKLHDPENGFYGFGYPAMITGGGDANTAFLVHIWASGGEVLDQNLRPTFYTPRNLCAFQQLLNWVPLITQPGRFETGYSEENELFASGKVAHIIQWMPACIGTITDPQTSTVVGKIGYAPVYGSATRGTGWAVGITSTSPHPEETWEFIKFLCSYEMCRDALLKYSNSLVRASLVNDQELAQELPWVPATVAALKQAKDLPKIPEKAAMRLIIGEETVAALQGLVTAEEALQNMDRRVEELMREAGYY